MSLVSSIQNSYNLKVDDVKVLCYIRRVETRGKKMIPTTARFTSLTEIMTRDFTDAIAAISRELPDFLVVENDGEIEIRTPRALVGTIQVGLNQICYSTVSGIEGKAFSPLTAARVIAKSVEF